MSEMGKLAKLGICFGAFFGGGAIGSGVYVATGHVAALPAIFGIIGLVVAIRWCNSR